MKTIPLQPLKCGKSALIDDDDWEEISKYTWYFNNTGYAVRVFRKDGKQYGVLMHRQILSLPPRFHTDHKNGNRIDNRKENIRPCNRSQNLCNQKLHSNNSSGIKGVRFHKTIKQWDARIQVQRKPIHLGYYATIEEARAAYDAASRILHGEFSRPNSSL